MEIRALGLTHDQVRDAAVMTPVGCSNCRQNGFRGRLAIAEIFRMDDEVRTAINDNISSVQLKRKARELGMRNLREDGIRKALAGMTTAAEVIEITVGDSD
jgi:type IV pilus assembly protein PilB